MAQADETLNAKASAALYRKMLARLQGQAHLAEGYDVSFNYGGQLEAGRVDHRVRSARLHRGLAPRIVAAA